MLVRGNIFAVTSVGEVITADDVTETASRVFVSPQQRDDLDELINNAEVVAGHVNTFADLPDVLASVGQKWIVDTATGVWGVNRKPAGTYLSTGTIWTSKYNAVDVINVLTSTQTQKSLSANMGRVVNEDLQAHKTNTANPHSTTFTQAVTADPATDITAAEAETLSDGSNADSLHEHGIIVDPAQDTTLFRTASGIIEGLIAGVRALAIRANRDLTFDNYNQTTRDDGVVNDEKVLTVDNSGNVLLRKVLPFSAYADSLVGFINQTETLAVYLTLNVNVPEEGDYWLEWYYKWSLNDGGDNFLGQIQFDGNPLPMPAAIQYPDRVQEPKDAGGPGVLLEDINNPGSFINSGTDNRHTESGKYHFENLSAGPHTFQILWACAGDINLEAAIYVGNLELRRRA